MGKKTDSFLRSCSAVKDKILGHFEPEHYAEQKERGWSRGKERSRSRERDLETRHNKKRSSENHRNIKEDTDHLDGKLQRRKTESYARGKEKHEIEVAGYRLSIERSKGRRDARFSQDHAQRSSHEKYHIHKEHKNDDKERSHHHRSGEYRSESSDHSHRRHRRRKSSHPKSQSRNKDRHSEDTRSRSYHSSNAEDQSLPPPVPPIPNRYAEPESPSDYEARKKAEKERTENERRVADEARREDPARRQAAMEYERKEAAKREASRLKREEQQREYDRQKEKDTKKTEEKAEPVGLPRSPRVLDLAREAKAPQPSPLNAENLKSSEEGYVEGGVASTFLNRQFGDPTRTYIEGMVPE